MVVPPLNHGGTRPAATARCIPARQGVTCAPAGRSAANPSTQLNPARTFLDLIRGALIGLVEIIPGVSGGTVALIIGVYETLVESVGEFVHGAVALVLGPLRGRGTGQARAHFGRVRWDVVIPLGIGMLLAVVVSARIVAPLVEQYPQAARAFFAGLILVSLRVPYRMVGGGWRGHEWLLAVAGAALAFWLTGLPAPAGEGGAPPLWLVALGAAVAICALVLPGLSGSFLLLLSGLYVPTLEALNRLDFVYIGTFILGAVLGLAGFVQVLRWLLARHRRVTLSLMTGLMAGSLRALWPWQGPDRELLAPSGQVGMVLGWFVLGVVIVTLMLGVERMVLRRGRTTAPGPANPG